MRFGNKAAKSPDEKGTGLAVQGRVPFIARQAGEAAAPRMKLETARGL